MQFTEITTEDAESVNEFTGTLLEGLNEIVEMTENESAYTKEEFVGTLNGLAQVMIQILTAGQMMFEASVLTEGITDQQTE